MTGRSTILYSSSLAIILIAISSLLTGYLQSPETVTVNELQAISEQLESFSDLINTDVDTFEPTKIDTYMAWLYPGAPACEAVKEASEFSFDVLKPEYFAVRDGGDFEFITADNYECNGYSVENAEQIKELSDEQFVMISSSYAQDMALFLSKDQQNNAYTQQIVDFVVENDFTGAELDFEDYGGWTSEIYVQYKAFVTRLGNALQAENKQLIIDLPPVRNKSEEAWYTFRLAELEQLPVDYIVIMGYDYQFDHGVGEPVAPLDWLEEVILFTRNSLKDTSKIVIGVPSYGYVGNTGSGQINILTKEQASSRTLFDSAVRDGESAEMIAERGQQVLVYQDQVSLDAKIAVVEKMGINKVSVWHLGGNVLPSR